MSGYFQISIYFFLFVIAYIIYKYLITKNKKDSGWVIFYLFIGLLFASATFAVDGVICAIPKKWNIPKNRNYPLGLSGNFFGSGFLGTACTRNDWFGHYAEWNSYIGLIPLMLGIYALFRKREKNIIFFGLMALLSILFSFQTPLLDLLVQLKIPVLSTSAASRIIVIFSFSMSVLSAFGFDILFQDLKNGRRKQIVYWFLLFAVFFAVLWAVVVLKLFLPLDKIIVARQNLFSFRRSYFLYSLY